ncbi:hypothetical protein [Myxosarcina sp. GI1]|uniref:hypothetical protein n=1 Tax=Myxosarcina sp. GI1 TaxID=1541065 RepID=UPI000564A86C|nr:hypothetical protein [Myxosarcina sp. GI1]
MSIERLLIRENCLLLVFHTKENSYQYEILFTNGATIVSRQIYYSEVQAYRKGIDMIELVLDRQ